MAPGLSTSVTTRWRSASEERIDSVAPEPRAPTLTVTEISEWYVSVSATASY